MGDGLLGAIEIERRLAAETIFRPDTWVNANLRGAAYDLRAARDGLNDPGGVRYPPGEERPEATLRLNQGDAALLSSVERFCLPWDVAGLMGVKFNLARRGVLMLTGVSVDPGYGLEFEGAGRWVAKADQRVHFLVTNVGNRPVDIELGTQAVASIQFAYVTEPDDDRKHRLATAMTRTTGENAELASDGVGFFTALEALRTEVTSQSALSRSQHEATTRALQRLRSDLDLTRGLTNTLVSLGIFVVLVSFLAGALGILFAVFQNGALSTSINGLATFLTQVGTNGIVIILAGLAAFVIFCIALTRVITAFISRSPTGK
jgi:deoxycytidine triphosphate deaminase